MRPRRASTAAVAVLVAGVLATAGCGGDPVAVPRAESVEILPLDPPSATPRPSTTTATPTPSSSPTPTPTPTAEPEPEPEEEPAPTEEPEPEPPASEPPAEEPEEPAEPEPTDVGTQAPEGGMSEREQEVVDLTNEIRADEGCGPLHADDRLHEAAVLHSEDMAERDYFDHVTPEGVGPGERAERAGYDSWGGENIAWGYRSAEDVVEGWMDSPGHRENILNCDFQAIGVGAADSDGGPYWTQMFGYE
ncbi:CAP domain-containing protein [Jiangella rhizosphaerae]|uniref:CAP domain-containing protein n=1 Tax=Jiangella rhizosphaerae TaxID=2293569 RepID=A0A418KXA6_9ACTN|nr:CAP domain-containing protein [Jiangella rhizosphaerae]RIQ35865.1 CAP domain-containing protein [Jiangella rhizosphaerae]